MTVVSIPGGPLAKFEVSISGPYGYRLCIQPYSTTEIRPITIIYYVLTLLIF